MWPRKYPARASWTFTCKSLALLFISIQLIAAQSQNANQQHATNRNNRLISRRLSKRHDDDEMGAKQSTNATTTEQDSKPAKFCKANKYDQLIAQQFANLSQPIVKADKTFENPFPTWAWPSLVDGMKIFFRMQNSSPRDDEERDKELPLLKPKFHDSLDGLEAGDYRVTWIGHATVLIQTGDFNILADPIFSDRASPLSFAGPKRIREPACNVSVLPASLDLAIISHNHYDHLDTDSVKQINARYGPECRWIVPLGVGEFLRSMGVENYRELSWWQRDCKTKVKVDGQEESIDIYLTPTQHWSRRGFDRNRSLWGSFAIVNQADSKFFFTGDTGYCYAFEEIGRIFGHFTGAAIPIGAYKPREFMKFGHVDPEEAVKIHKDIRSHNSIAIHHATFILSEENYKEPAEKLTDLMEQEKHNDGPNWRPFRAVKHGETVVMKAPSTGDK